MAKIRIYNRNAIQTAILSGGSWDATLDLDKLRDPQPRLKARSTDSTTTSTQFRVVLASPITVKGIQLVSTNFSGASRYKITWYPDDTFTTPTDTTDWQAVGDSIDWTDTDEWLDWLDANFWLGSSAFIDPDNQGRDVRHHFAVAVSLQYIKIEIDDVSNADGFVEIGYLYIGQTFEPSINISYSPSFSRESLTAGQSSVGGAQYFSRRGSRRKLSVAWNTPGLPSDEVLGEMDDIIQIHDVDKPVYVELDYENDMTGAKTAFLARISQLPAIQLQAVFFDNDTAASVGFELEQVL